MRVLSSTYGSHGEVEPMVGVAVRALGGRSLVRKAAGIGFPGWDSRTSNLIAEVETVEEPEWGPRRDALGIQSLSRKGDGVR